MRVMRDGSRVNIDVFAGSRAVVWKNVATIYIDHSWPTASTLLVQFVLRTFLFLKTVRETRILSSVSVGIRSVVNTIGFSECSTMLV